MPKKVAKKNWLFIVLFLVLYGGLYIVLRNKILFTPDLSASDAFHFNASLKYYLWKSIRAGIVPFWTDQLQSGFPLLAEGQIGALFLPHYLIFPFFSSFPHAYMFLFAFCFDRRSIGTAFHYLRNFTIGNARTIYGLYKVNHFILHFPTAWIWSIRLQSTPI